MARYDEVFEDADITYGASDDDACKQPVLDKPVCIGVNTDCQGHALKPLPLYTSKSGSLSATCTDCFASLSTDIYMQMKMGGFKLQSLELGLRNATLDAHITLDARADNKTTLAIDKALELVPQTFLLDFKVGKVPFMLFFDVPLSINAELDFERACKHTVRRRRDDWPQGDCTRVGPYKPLASRANGSIDARAQTVADDIRRP